MHTEQNQMNRGSKDKSLSFCFLLNNQITSIKFKKNRINKAIPTEKSILIIYNRYIIISLPRLVMLS